MFTKFKQAIENWLRDLIADEVSKIDHDLSNERAAVGTTIRCCASQINAAVDRLNELSHIKENTELREHIKELHARSTEIGDLFKKLHPSLKV
jgi:hypothetical protein